MKNTLISIVAFSACALALSMAPVAPCLTSSGGATLTVHVGCEQDEVDQPHKVEVTVSETSDPTHKKTVTVFVQPHESSGAIAESIAVILSLTYEGVSVAETSNPRFSSEHHNTEDVKFPPGLTLDKVKVSKLVGGQYKPDSGHLQMYNGKQKLGQGAPGQGPVVVPLANMHIDVSECTAVPLMLSMDLYGFDTSTGGRYSVLYEKTFPTTHTVAQCLTDVGTQLTRLGFTVTYPSNHELSVVLTSARTVDQAFFCAAEADLTPFVANTVECAFNSD